MWYLLIGIILKWGGIWLLLQLDKRLNKKQEVETQATLSKSIKEAAAVS